jgi:hypothetical protein
MVDILIDWQAYEFEFAGETIKMELKPMDTRAVFSLMGISTDSPDEKQVDIMQAIFVDYVRNIENLTFSGAQAQPEQLATVPQLMPLSGLVMAKLSEISNLQDGDKKKLDKQSTSPPQSEVLTS